MKCTYILIVLFFCANIGLAQQNGISLSVNDGPAGTGFHISYVKKVKDRISLGGGVRIHHNPIIKFRSGAFFDHTAFAKNFNQRMGFSAFIEYQFKKKRRTINPFVGYHTQVLSTARKVVLLPQDGEPTLFEWSKPLTVWDNNIIAGLNFKLSNRMNLKANTGLGFSFLYNTDDLIIQDDKNPLNNKTWQGNHEFNLTLVYWFTSNKKKK